jgi:NADH-quinone oxidoreductase subunit M
VALPGWSVVAALGVILAAIYLLWAYQRVFTGPLDRPENESVPDLSGREIALMVPLVVLMLYLGLQPRVLLDRIAPSTDAVIERVAEATGYRVELPAAEILAEAPNE